jgi:putative transposase
VGGPQPHRPWEKGVKRRLVVEAAGGPLGAALAGANVHDTKLLAMPLETIGVVRPQPTEEAPQPLGLDQGSDNPIGHETVAAFQYVPPL